MHFLIVADSFPPSKNSTAVQIRHLSQEFFNQGHKVTLFIPTPDIKKSFEVKKLDFARVIYIRVPFLKSSRNTIRRSDVSHICKSSNVGAKIFESKIPISKETRLVSDEFNINPTICALHGGEDYELLVAISQTDYKKINKNTELTPIGHITSKDNIDLIRDSGEEINLKKEGWDSFLSKKSNTHI